MKRLVMLASAMLVTVLALQFPAEALDQNEQQDPEKKAVDKKGKKKVEEKKVEEKKEEKKVEEKKEEKKEPFVPDAAQVELKGHTDWVFAIAFGSDGKSLVSSGRDRTIRAWDLAAKKETQILKGLPESGKGLTSHAGTFYTTTGKWNKEKKAWEGEIRAWDGKAGKEGNAIKAHSSPIESLSITKDGKTLLSAGEDQTAIVWDIAGGKEVQTLKGHTKAIHGAAITADGKRAATASADSTVRLWNVADGKELGTFKLERKVERKDAKGKVTEAVELGGEFTTAAFSPDGKKLAVGNLDGQIFLLDGENLKQQHELKAHDGVWALAFSPDGKKLATGGWDQTIRIWDVNAAKEIALIKAHLSTVTAVAFSPDGSTIASASTDGLIKLWPASGKK